MRRCGEAAVFGAVARFLDRDIDGRPALDLIMGGTGVERSQNTLQLCNAFAFYHRPVSMVGYSYEQWQIQ